jgi:membrane-associated phospholipid phosphatase
MAGTMKEFERNSGKDIPGLRLFVINRQNVLIIIGTAIVLWSVSFLLWQQVEIDKWILFSQNDLRTNEFAVSIAQAASQYGMSFIVLAYLLNVLLTFKNENHRDAYTICLLVILMFGVAGIGGDLLQKIFNRPRPFVEYAGEINALSNAASPSFPSGHATKSIALALPFLLLVPARDNWHKVAKILLVIIATGVCFSRMVLGAHFLSDVLAGAGMALVCFPFVTLLTNKIIRRVPAQRLDGASKVWAVILLILMIYLAVQ